MLKQIVLAPNLGAKSSQGGGGARMGVFITLGLENWQGQDIGKT